MPTSTAGKESLSRNKSVWPCSGATGFLYGSNIKGIVKRLQGRENAVEELTQGREKLAVAESIFQDAEARGLLTILTVSA